MDAAHERLVTLALWCTVFGVGTGGWFAYFRLKERAPRPFAVMLAATLGGYAAALASVMVYEQLEQRGVMPTWHLLECGGVSGIMSSLTIGLVEEGAKFLPTALVILIARKRVHETKDGLFIAACAGVGFASAENMLLWAEGMGCADSLARAVASPVTHALFAAPWGLGLGRLVRTGKPWLLAAGFPIAVIAHAAYDLLLASPELPHAVAAVEVLTLWMWMLTRTAPQLATAVVRTTGALRKVAPARTSASVR